MQKSSNKIKPDLLEEIKDKTRKASKKKRKNKNQIAPRFEIGDVIVIGTEPNMMSNSRERHYMLVEIIDWVQREHYYLKPFVYYCHIKEVSKEEYLDRIGGIVHFSESDAGSSLRFGDYRPINVCVNDMKWIEK